MTDIFLKSKRSEMVSKVKNKDSKIETFLEKYFGKTDFAIEKMTNVYLCRDYKQNSGVNSFVNKYI